MNNKKIIGVGKPVVKCDKSFIKIVDGGETNNIEITNIEFTGNVNFWSPCIQIKSCNFVTITDCKISNFKSCCIWLEDCKFIDIENNECSNSEVSAGIYVGSKQRDVYATIKQNKCYSNALDGIGVYGNYINVIENECFNNGTDSPRAGGLYANTVNFLQVSRNKFYENTGNGVDIVNADNTLVEYNTTTNNQCCGILIGGASYRVNISHNISSGNGINPIDNGDEAQKWEYFLMGGSLFEFSHNSSTYKTGSEVSYPVYNRSKGLVILNNAFSGYTTNNIKSTEKFNSFSFTEHQPTN